MLLRRLLLVCLLAFSVMSPVGAKTPRPYLDIPLQTPTGQKITVKQYHAKVVLLVIFSLTCDDCIKTINLMSKMQKDYGSYGFQALAAAGDPNAKFGLGLFLQRYRPSFPVGYVDQDAIIKLADVPNGVRPFVPIALFITNTNDVRFQFYGDNAFFKQEEHGLRSIVEGMLKQAGAKIEFGEKH
jgi:hypothetical protein